MNLSDNNESTAAAQLDGARRKQWHQQGEALLTIENARSFLNAAGLVLFTPRPQIAAPAPSFVEAVLGEPNATPSLAQSAPARELLARLVAEGLAVPLNLLGVGSVVGQPGDAPDFIASAHVFSYIFTLRGDKGWKQPPQPVGPSKFSHLAIAAHEALTRLGTMTAYDLAREVGKEATEAAVLRALGELWSHLRVLPLPQLDGHATVWELATARLSKQIKAGANAGLPTALSALISLYLGQAIVASEDEVESFLSPLAARSRIRDVVHALVAARQLDTIAIEGKTVLHIAGDAPAFLSEEPASVASVPEGEIVPAADEAGQEDAVPQVEEPATHMADSASRIAKFTPRRKSGAGELAKAKPAKFARNDRSAANSVRKPFGEKKPFAPRGEKGRPPFREGKSARPFGDRSGFKPRSEAGGVRKRSFADDGKPPFEKKRFTPRSEDSRSRFEKRDREGSTPDRERRPFAREARGGERGPRKPFDRSAEGRPPRRSFDGPRDKPIGRKPFGGSSERPARKPFGGSSERPTRKPFDRTGERPAGRKPFGGSSERPARKPFDRLGERPAGRKPFSKPDRFGPRREFASKGDSEKRGFKPGSFGGSKPFRKRDESGEEGKTRPGGFGGKRPFTREGGPGKPFRSGERTEGGRPARTDRGGAKFGGSGFGAKKFGGKRFGDSKPGGKKFGAKPGGRKPFDRPKTARKPKPSGESEA